MITTVNYWRAGQRLASTVVEGRLLPLQVPTSVTVSQTIGAVELIEDKDPTRECCGEIPLVAISDHGRITVQKLNVPPPPPFDLSDVASMWEARNRLDLRRRAPTSGLADWSSLNLTPSQRAQLLHLPNALQSAERLLGRWPRQPLRRSASRPTDLPGGRVDLQETFRRALRLGLASVGGRQLPVSSVRSFGGQVDRECLSVSAIAEVLRFSADKVLNDTPWVGPELRARMLRPLALIARRAESAANTVDEPPSTWPNLMRRFYSDAAVALSEIHVSGSGVDSAPLSELWELYEAWVTDRVLAALIAALGEPDQGEHEASLLGRWLVEGSVVEMHRQLNVPAKPGRCVTVCGADLHAVIGDLTPDIVLVATRQAEVRLLVVDPKKRGFLDSGAVSAEASKYLWGMRGSAVLDSVVLVGPVGGAASARPEGLAWCVKAHPADSGLWDGTVTEWLNRLR